MRRLFISYRSLDSTKVDALITRLRTLTDPNFVRFYEVWQDKDSIPAGMDWWQAIVNGIENCQYFIFMVSRESVKNRNCRAELSYARKRNRPIIPLVLEGEFAYNTVTGKNDIDYWSDIPDELNDMRAQFLFYEGVGWLGQLSTAIEMFEREPQRWRDLPAGRPLDPRHASDTNNHGGRLYDEAYDYAFRLELTTAERLFQKLVNMNDPNFSEEAHQWIGILRYYQMLLEFDMHSSTRFKVPPVWRQYIRQFPKPFIDLFDPKDFKSRYRDVATSPTAASILTAEQWFEKGKESTNIDEKIRFYTAAIIHKLDYAIAYVNRGLAYSNKGEYDYAIADYTEAIRLKPNYAEAYYHRGLAFYDKNEQDNALSDYTEAIRLKPDYAEAYNRRGYIHVNSYDYHLAISDQTEAIRLKPDYAEAYNHRGYAHVNDGNYDSAIADYIKAIHLKPDYAEAYTDLGNVYSIKKDYVSAIANYEIALRIDPNYQFAKDNLERAVTEKANPE